MNFIVRKNLIQFYSRQKKLLPLSLSTFQYEKNYFNHLAKINNYNNQTKQNITTNRVCGHSSLSIFKDDLAAKEAQKIPDLFFDYLNVEELFLDNPFLALSFSMMDFQSPLLLNFSNIDSSDLMYRFFHQCFDNNFISKLHLSFVNGSHSEFANLIFNIRSLTNFNPNYIRILHNTNEYLFEFFNKLSTKDNLYIFENFYM